MLAFFGVVARGVIGQEERIGITGQQLVLWCFRISKDSIFCWSYYEMLCSILHVIWIG